MVKMTMSPGYCSFRVHWTEKLSSINPLTLIWPQPAGYCPVQNQVVAIIWMNMNWYTLVSRQVSLLAIWSLVDC